MDQKAPEKKVFLFSHFGWGIWRFGDHKYQFVSPGNKKYMLFSWKEGRELINRGLL